MTGCHGDDSVTFLQAGDFAADAFDDAGAFEGGGSVAGLDLACVDEDVLCADTRSQRISNKDGNGR